MMLPHCWQIMTVTVSWRSRPLTRISAVSKSFAAQREH